MIKLYTIGFTEKSARRFFELLEENDVKKIVDIRISNSSQLAGFAKGRDLEFFAERIGGIGYEHRIEFAPTREMLDAYRHKKMTWENYMGDYLTLLEQRGVRNTVNTAELHESCLLCSEHDPEKCHRRVLAEFLQRLNPAIEIIHLQ